MQQLSALDASFLYLETRNAPMHVAGVGIYDPSTAKRPVGFAELIENTRRRLHLAPCFRRRLVHVPFDADHPYWIEDPDFHLEHHVLHQGLPPPGTWRQLMDLIGRLMSRPLDQSRPLWELHVIEGLVDDRFPAGSIVVFSKVHHCAIDGVSGVEITTALHDLTPDPEIETADTWRPERVPSEAELLMRTYGRAAARSMQLADLLGRSMRSVARVGSDVARGEVLLPPSPFTAPPTHFNRPVSPHRVIDGRFFDLEEIRAVKRTIPDATVNDVVLAICAGGLRSFLAARGELPRRPLVAMAPISVREAAQKDTLGNQVSAMLVSLATDQPDPRVRLETIHQSAVSSKVYTNAVGAKLLTDYSQFIPGATAALAARLYSQMRGSLLHPPIFNCVITNVPGPQVPLYSCGSRLVASFGGGPIFDGMGLIIPVGSYCGDLVVSVTSDREMLPEPAELCDAFVDAFTELKQATGIARPRAKRKPRASPRAPATGTRRES